MGKCTLFENAHFHTGRSETEVFSYMLVEKGRIKALSNERPAPQEYCRRVDLGGGHAYPCLIDGHTHLLYTIVAGEPGKKLLVDRMVSYKFFCTFVEYGIIGLIHVGNV